MSAAAGLLQGVHAVLAMSRGQHWLLNDQDAKAYGLALSNALRHLPVTMAQKYIDFSALALAVVAYEGPRVAIDIQLRAQRQGQQQRPSQGRGPMFQFRQQQPPPRPPNGSAEPPPPSDGTQAGPPPDMTYEPDWSQAA